MLKTCALRQTAADNLQMDQIFQKMEKRQNKRTPAIAIGLL